jgi:hypothetical protein
VTQSLVIRCGREGPTVGADAVVDASAASSEMSNLVAG